MNEFGTHQINIITSLQQNFILFSSDSGHGRSLRLPDGSEPGRQHQVRLEKHLLDVRPRGLRPRREHRRAQLPVDDVDRGRVLGRQAHRDHRLGCVPGQY